VCHDEKQHTSSIKPRPEVVKNAIKQYSEQRMKYGHRNVQDRKTDHCDEVREDEESNERPWKKEVLSVIASRRLDVTDSQQQIAESTTRR
jgi:hypothetical protein